MSSSTPRLALALASLSAAQEKTRSGTTLYASASQVAVSRPPFATTSNQVPVGIHLTVKPPLALKCRKWDSYARNSKLWTAELYYTQMLLPALAFLKKESTIPAILIST